MKKLIISLLLILLLCQAAYTDGPLSREKRRFGYDSPNGWLYITVWPERPWLDTYEFVGDDGSRRVTRLLRATTSGLVILDMAIVNNLVLIVTVTEECDAQLFSPYMIPLRFERAKEPPSIMRRINL